ncbi:MAG: hypothetical protein EOM87_00500 [Clostridia bacterium]|nr:hypothetical protein [Clostridia bacterium]
MSRVKTGRGSGGGKCCLTCLIVSVVILVLFVGGVFLGTNYAFNTYVSPHIGGVTLAQTLSLISGLYKADRDAIVVDEFGAEDLNAFYENLNIALFQQPYTETENYDLNLAEYDALTQSQKDAMTEAERTTFLAKVNYRINIRSILEAANFDELIAGGQNTDEPAEAGYIASAEGEGGENPISEILKTLLFNFSTLSAYSEDDEDALANMPFVTLTITGKQVAAVVNEIVSIILAGENSPLNNIEQLQGIDDITDYIKVPQVIIEYTKVLADCATQEEYDKSVRFTLTVEVKLGAMIDFAFEQFSDQIPTSVPSSIINIIKRLIPKVMFLTVGAYPLDNTQEAYVRINNYNDEQISNMTKVINGVMNLLKPEVIEGEPSSEDSASTSILVEINSKIADVFTKIKDQNIAFDFVMIGNSAGMQLRHIEMMLSIMGLINPDDPYNLINPGEISSVTPHMFLSAMKCLTVSYKDTDPDYGVVAKNYLDADRTAFLTAFENSFGINAGYLSGEGVSLLDQNILQSLPNHISLSHNIDYDLTSEQMRVDLLDKALAALLSDALASGLLTNQGESATAEGDEGGGEQFDFLSKLSFNQLAIAKHGDDVILANPVFFAGTPQEFTVAQASQSIYELRLVMAVSLSDLLGDVAGEGEQSEIIQTVFGSLDNLYISAAVYIEEIRDILTGNIYLRTVGGANNPAAFRVNKFTYANTDKVFQTISLMMLKLQGGEDPDPADNPFDITDISSKVEEMLDTMFSTLETNLKAEIRLADGKMILPSIYEVISGVVNDKATVPEDMMTPDEIHGVFSGIYDSGIEVINNGGTASPDAVYTLERYDPLVGDAFLAYLSSSYYMKEQIDTAALYDSAQINNMFSASSLKFTGTGGLYTDDRAMEILSVPMTGDALAAMLISSGQLDQLGGGTGDGLLKKLTVINAVIRSESGVLYIDFELVAHLKEEAPAAAGEGEMQMEGFLPDLIYVTASVLVYADAYTPESPRFNTTVAVNKMEEAANANLYKLIRLLSGEDAFDTASITGEIESAMEQSFQSMEDNINLTYYAELTEINPAFSGVRDALNEAYGAGTCVDTDTVNTIVLANVFNTLNKLSNKEDPLYVSDPLDDIALRARLQEFGREPDKSYDITNTTGIMYLDNIFALGDSDGFIDNFNRYYYIDQTNRLTAEGLLASDGFFASSSGNADSFNFKSAAFVGYPGLYLDNTPYSTATFAVRMSDKALAELIYSGSGEIDPISGLRNNRIMIGGSGDYAIITQTKIYETLGVKYLSLSMQVYLANPAPAPGEDPAEVLPEYLFVTVVTEMDPLMTDPDSVTGDDLILFVNGMTEGESTDFFARLNKLSSSMGFDMAGFNETTLKDNAVDAIKKGFEQLSDIDGVTYGEDVEGGYLRLPDVFTYLVNYCSMTEPSALPTTGEQLCERMREFGRTPDMDGNEIEDVIYYMSVDILGFDALNTFDNTDADDFLVTFNRNFYLSQTKIMTISSLFAGNFAVDGNTFNFNNTFEVSGVTYSGLYVDTRDYSELEIRLTDAQLGSLIKQKEDGFSVSNGGGGSPDVAEIIQISVIFDIATGHYMLKTIILYTPSTLGSSMPDYLFITSYTDLDVIDGFGDKTYATYIVVNDLSEEETARFFDNINALQITMNISSNVQKATIENAISDKFKEVFNDQLGVFGDIEFHEGYIKLPNMFEYVVTDSTLNSGDGMLDYAVTPDGERIVDGGNPTGYVTTATDPENLMLRIRAFGSKPSEGQNIDAEDGVSVYNDNRYAVGDDNYFYDLLTYYYYLINTPSSSDLYSGTIFTTIDDTSFNLSGNPAAVAGTPNRAGLYHYSGSQYKARISDRALAAILAAEGDSVSSASLDISIETLKMYYDGDDNLIFEITSKAVFGITAGESVPEYVYITSFTKREDNGLGGYTYTTTLVANNLAVTTGNTLNLTYNMSQMETYGMSFDAFDTDAICADISNMVKNALDSLSTGLNISYKTYANDPVVLEAGEEGVGYIELKSIYGIISDTTLDDDTDNMTALTMQGMIVKLHDPNIETTLITNPKEVGGEPDIDYSNFPVSVTSYTTDRVFADKIGTINEDGVTLTSDQAMFISINSANPEKADWTARFDAASAIGFAFDIGEDYIAVTGNVELAAFVTSSVSLLPERIYVSLIMNADDSAGFNPIMMFNEMTKAEKDLFLQIADGGGSADLSNLTTHMVTRINATLVDLLAEISAGSDDMVFIAKDDDYPDCVGYLKVTVVA